MSGLTRDGTAGPVSRDQIIVRQQGQGNIHFPRSADHEQDWGNNLTRLILTLAVCDDQTYIQTYSGDELVDRNFYCNTGVRRTSSNNNVSLFGENFQIASNPSPYPTKTR